MNVLILEDDLLRVKQFERNWSQHTLTFTDKVDECITLLKNNKYDIVSLDHDLGGQQMISSWGPEETGYLVAAFLEHNPMYQPTHIFLHSANPVGVANMQKALPRAHVTPVSWTKELR